LRIFAVSALKLLLNAETAESRREPQRKTASLSSLALLFVRLGTTAFGPRCWSSWVSRGLRSIYQLGRLAVVDVVTLALAL